MKLLRRTQFGNPVLRQVAKRLSKQEVLSSDIQDLIASMHYTLSSKKKYGIGLAAPQVGKSVALAVIGIKPTETRPNNPIVNLVVINPEVVKKYGQKEPMWEGCISFGDPDNFPYAQVPRYKKNPPKL